MRLTNTELLGLGEVGVLTNITNENIWIIIKRIKTTLMQIKITQASQNCSCE